MGIEQYANSASTTLAAQLNSGATSISLSNGSSFPTGLHRIKIDNELILIASRSSNTLTVATNGRGSEGTSDVTHSNGATVEHVLTRRGLFSAPGWYDVRAYGAVGSPTDDSTAIQAAITAAVADGGGVVYIPTGTWSVGTTGLTISGNNVTIRGAGKRATTLVYTGSGSCIANSDTGSIRRNGGVEDLMLDLTGASTNAIGISVYNFLRCHFERLYVKCQGVVADGIRLTGSGSHSTYFNVFRDIEITTDGKAIHITGGAVNRNYFDFINCDGTNGQALVMNATGTNHDTNLFQFLSAENMGGNPVIQLTGSGGALTAWTTFIHPVLEGCTYGPEIVSGGADYNLVIGGSVASGDTWAGWDSLNAWFHHDESGDYTLKVEGKLDPQNLNIQTKAGVPSDSDVFYAISGDMVLDTTNSRIYFRVGSTWKYASLT